MIKITESDDLTVWFTTDLHLNHQGPRSCTPLWESRGYKNPSDMTEQIIKIINDFVKPKDILFNLGDLFLNSTLEQVENILSQIACQTMYCMFGNHPNPHYNGIYVPLVKELLGDKYLPGMEVFPLRYKNLVYLNNFQEINVNGQRITLCHYALQVWNHSGTGSWALVGHSHGSLPTILPDSKCGKILDVGFDIFKKPISFKEVKAIMDKKPLLTVDHH